MVKKIPSLLNTPKHGLRTSPTITWVVGPCVMVGEGFMGFLGLREKIFFLVEIPWGWSYPNMPSF
jgi:hypothetical protein